MKNFVLFESFCLYNFKVFQNIWLEILKKLFFESVPEGVNTISGTGEGERQDFFLSVLLVVLLACCCCGCCALRWWYWRGEAGSDVMVGLVVGDEGDEEPPVK